MTFAPDCRLARETRMAAGFGERRSGAPVDMLVLHYTGMVDGQAALERLTAEGTGVSCHYLVFESGDIVQMVPEGLRAWHAGLAHWRGHTDVNSRSVGVEICNPGHLYGYRSFPDVQIEAVIALCADIMGRHPIEPRNVVAHSDVAPSRKCDPGELFPWDRLAGAGIGHWVEPEPARGNAGLGAGDRGDVVRAVQEQLALYGYGLEANGEFDGLTEQCVTAFQRHFRPSKVDGVADRSTLATLRKLIQGLSKSG